MAKRPHYHEPRYPGHRRPKYRRRTGSAIGSALAGASLLAGAVGTGVLLSNPEQRAEALSVVRDFGVGVGFVRERTPQEGDHWRGCDDAHAAGTAPIYRGEPGYREGMDGDSDGIACEPYR